MALVDCPECSKQISTAASSCPHCGHPLRKANPEPQFIAWRKRLLTRYRVLAAVIILVGLLFLGKSPGVTAYVSGLGLFGVIVTSIRLSSLERKE
jgi:hypothetical protein